MRLTKDGRPWNSYHLGRKLIHEKIKNMDYAKIYKAIDQGLSANSVGEVVGLCGATVIKYLKDKNHDMYVKLRKNGLMNRKSRYIDGRGITRRFKTDICFDCGAKDKKLEIHHIKPCQYTKNYSYAIKGDHSPDNLVTLCNSCHQKRHWKDGTRVHKVKHNSKNGRFERNGN